MENSMGMKWHKFLIYFSLWVAAISNLITGVLALSVLIDPPGRYRYNDGLVMGAVLCGIAMIACGIWCIIVRNQLAKFRTGAPGKLLAVQLISLAASTAFTMMDMDASITTAIAPLAVIILTRVYYNKRDHLFYT